MLPLNVIVYRFFDIEANVLVVTQLFPRFFFYKFWIIMVEYEQDGSRFSFSFMVQLMLLDFLVAVV